MNKTIKIISILISSFLLGGCASYFAPVRTTPAKLGPKTEVNKDLTSLPAPKEKIVAAVYKFRDQTGQYKPSSTGANWSTAVTQGATSILLKALEESNWFIAIEREGLSNLLNERKIIRSSRANFSNDAEDQGPLLPPLLYAGIILEGGIISYDSNVLTGGAGLQYFGAGVSNQYREDRVSIYLRAISTQSGRILKTVYTTKTILSQMVDVGLYRFVSFKKLLEAETGYSYNEPVELCVTEAIEKAVQSLIIEGVYDNLWELKNPEEINTRVIKDYETEKLNRDEIDFIGRPLADRGEYSVSLNFGGQYYHGDYPDPFTKPAGELNISKTFFPGIKLSLSLGRGQLSVKRAYFDNTFDYVSLYGNYSLFPQNKFSPFIYGGLGLLIEDKGLLELTNNIYPYLESGLGLEYMLFKNISANTSISYQYLFNDNLDGMVHGKLNDYVIGFKIGFTYYFEIF